MQHLDIFGSDPKLVSHDLRPRSLVALTVRCGSRDDLDFAGREHTNSGVFPAAGTKAQSTKRTARGEATDLDIGTEPDAKLLRRAGVAPGLLLGSKIAIPG